MDPIAELRACVEGIDLSIAALRQRVEIAARDLPGAEVNVYQWTDGSGRPIMADLLTAKVNALTAIQRSGQA